MGNLVKLGSSNKLTNTILEQIDKVNAIKVIKPKFVKFTKKGKAHSWSTVFCFALQIEQIIDNNWWIDANVKNKDLKMKNRLNSRINSTKQRKANRWSELNKKPVKTAKHCKLKSLISSKYNLTFTCWTLYPYFTTGLIWKLHKMAVKARSKLCFAGNSETCLKYGFTGKSVNVLSIRLSGNFVKNTHIN